LAKRMPEVEDALERAGLDDRVAGKLDYDTVVDDIENSHDWLALAERDEFETWSEIATLENSAALQADTPEAKEARDKVALLKGVLQWELEREFRDRLWRVRRHLRDAGEVLVEAQRSRRRIDRTMRSEPLRFAELSDRVYGLAPRIEGMKTRVEDAMTAQRGFLQEIAVGELQAQKQRLDVYTIQARFALAAIYDTAATLGEGAP
ncbi:MAG: hypothetical protein MJA32_10740, partial [Proteobacteria bacterium]|nr:hypothetical protein [Pseudomonadota bacterium]